MLQPSLSTDEKGIFRRSGGANSIASLASSKGAVYMNPDGTFVYLNPAKNEYAQQRGSSTSSQTNENQQIILPVFGDDELAFFINPADLPEFVDEVLDTYILHSRIFLAFLLFQIAIEGLFDYVVYYNQEQSLKQVIKNLYLKLALIYSNVPSEEIQKMFRICFIVDVLFFVVYYPLGVLGIHKKSYKMLSSFATLSIVGIFVQIFLSYINKFNMLIFFFRVFSYIYSKFLAHLVLNLILLPH